MKKERTLITVSQEPGPPSHRKDPQAPKANTASMVSSSKCSNSTVEGSEKKKKKDGKKKKP